MQAEFQMKVQVIRSKGRATRLFINVPLPLAAALDLQAGEPVRWQLLDRASLRLIRLAPPRPRGRLKK
jgi:hypothetical protein